MIRHIICIFLNLRALPLCKFTRKQIETMNASDGYHWLGFNFTYTDKFQELVVKKFEKTKPNVSKFYPWLQIDGDAPFVFKMRVVYSCMFESIIYSCEPWCDTGHISDSLLAIELKLCMEVKQPIQSNLIYT